MTFSSLQVLKNLLGHGLTYGHRENSLVPSLAICSGADSNVALGLLFTTNQTSENNRALPADVTITPISC